MTSDDASAAQPTAPGPRFALLRAACFGYVSFLWTLVWYVVCMLALPLAPRTARFTHAVVRLWARGYLGSFGAGVRVEQAQRLDAGVARLIVANHASWLDPPALIVAFPGQVRFFLKRELLRVPFVGWYAAVAGHFLLDRGNPREGKRQLERAVARALKYRISPVIFPEGTRTRDGRLAPLKAGSFQLAIAAGLDVQPVAIFGTWDMFPPGATFPRRGGDIVLRVGEPIRSAGLEGSAGRRELAARVTQALHDLGVD